MIPEEIREAILGGFSRYVPALGGFVVLLPARSNVGCPSCGCSMGFAVVRQVIRLDARLSGWLYACLACTPQPTTKAAA